MNVTVRCDSCGKPGMRAIYEDRVMTPCGKCGGKMIRVSLFDKRINTQKKHIEASK